MVTAPTRITGRVIRRHEVHGKILACLPARVLEGDGIDIDRTNGVYTFSLDYTEFSEVTDLDTVDLDDTYIALQQDEDGFIKVSTQTLIDELSGVGTAFNIEVVIEGIAAVITPGIKGDFEVSFDFEIEQVTMLADQVGSIVVDIWKDTYVNFPPTDADSITGAAPPTISADDQSVDSTLTGWTTAVSAGDTLRFNVDSASAITRVTLSLKCART